jgi:protein tyrosine/serine phosphatase
LIANHQPLAQPCEPPGNEVFMYSVRNRRRAAVLILTLSIAAPYQAFAEKSGALSRISIENFGQINDGYFRGAQPKGDDYADLAAIGIKTIIDLSNDQETEAQSVQSAGMKFIRIPLTTTAAPAQTAVQKFLALVNDPANQPVYVHCQGGRHRTGVMTAAYRMTHDHWTPDRAFAEMVQYEFKKGFVSHNALKNFVYKFSTAVADLAVSSPTDRQ